MAARILIVDDDEASRAGLAKTLTASGYSVESAPDYRDALNFLEGTSHFDLLLTDVIMPEGINGLALARMARMRRPGIKVIYLTGFDIAGASDEAMGTILLKPIDMDDLLREVERTLGSPGRQQGGRNSTRGI